MSDITRVGDDLWHITKDRPAGELVTVESVGCPRARPRPSRGTPARADIALAVAARVRRERCLVTRAVAVRSRRALARDAVVEAARGVAAWTPTTDPSTRAATITMLRAALDALEKKS